MSKFLLVLWILQSGGWGHVPIWFHSLEACVQRGEQLVYEDDKAYGFVCIQRPDAPVSA